MTKAQQTREPRYRVFKGKGSRTPAFTTNWKFLANAYVRYRGKIRPLKTGFTPARSSRANPTNSCPRFTRGCRSSWRKSITRHG